ncbi:MAG: hypothetical protein JNJ46_15445 [Myxococcales bacterium]|nr:hypothetical protein [Myxococcales bacterium]
MRQRNALRLVGVLCLAAVACREGSQPRPAAQSDSETFASAVGFQVGAGSSGIVISGQFATVPGGQEERLIPTLPNATQVWLSTCAGQLSERAASVDIWLTLLPGGKVKEARAMNGATPLSRCLVDEISRQTLSGLSLSSETRIALRLALSKTA